MYRSRSYRRWGASHTPTARLEAQNLIKLLELGMMWIEVEFSSDKGHVKLIDGKSGIAVVLDLRSCHCVCSSFFLAQVGRAEANFTPDEVMNAKFDLKVGCGITCIFWCNSTVSQLCLNKHSFVGLFSRCRVIASRTTKKRRVPYRANACRNVIYEI